MYGVVLNVLAVRNLIQCRLRKLVSTSKSDIFIETYCAEIEKAHRRQNQLEEEGKNPKDECCQGKDCHIETAIITYSKHIKTYYELIENQRKLIGDMQKTCDDV